MSVAVEKGKLAKTRILVLGDVMLDRYVVGSVNRISPEAPVPILNIEAISEKLGGAGNVALNLSSFSQNVSIVSLFGYDHDSEKLSQKFTDAGVHLHKVVRHDYRAIVKTRIMSKGQQLMRLDDELVKYSNGSDQVYNIVNNNMDAFDVLLLSDYGKGTLLECDNIINLCVNQNKPVLIDPKGDDYSKYKNATVITPNRSEFVAVMGDWRNEEELFSKAHELRRTLNLDCLLLTRSEEGMTLFDVCDDRDTSFHVPALAKEVYDVTGAGDTVIALLTAMIAAGYTMREAVIVANKAASIAVERLGAAQIKYEDIF